MTHIIPVILAGGTGTRLWPLSRESYPKQFCAFDTPYSLFEQSVQRAAAVSKDGLIVVGNYQHRFIIAEQLRRLGVENATILLEPVGKDSAAAIVAAAAFTVRKWGDAVLWIMPSDAYIEGQEGLCEDITIAAAVARDHGYLLLLGVAPTQAQTGYGYIKQGAPLMDRDKVFDVASFHEKPSPSQAKEMLAHGGYFWNAGMFIARAEVILAQAKQFLPELEALVSQALTQAEHELSFYILNQDIFKKIQPISFDYGIVEKASHVAFVPASFIWSDLGTWQSLWEMSPKDDKGNVTHGNTLLRACQDNYVHADKTLTVLNHVKDLVVVTTTDAILVSDQKHVQDVKHLVGDLKSSGRKEGVAHARMYRPWGYYETLIVGGRFKVKYIHVKPGGQLSLQKHYHRAEHWVVVEGTALITCQDSQKLLMENESAYLPAGSQHRLENPGKITLVVIEIQSGAYLGEDDIVRFQDAYSRKSPQQ